MNGEKPMTNTRLLALALFAALLATACPSEDKSATLVIEKLMSNPPAISLQIALSPSPDFLGGYKAYTAEMSDTSGPLSFSSIPCEDKEGNSGPRELWLLVAQDYNGGTPDEIINDGDYILPAMRVVLYPGQTTSIQNIIFDTSHVHTATFGASPRNFRIAIAGGNGISAGSPLILQLDILTIPIAEPMLASGLALRTSATNGYAFIDSNGNYGWDSGEWRTHASAVPLQDYNIWTLYTSNP